MKGSFSTKTSLQRSGSNRVFPSSGRLLWASAQPIPKFGSSRNAASWQSFPKMRIFRSEYREYSAALGGSCAIWKFAAAGISLVTGSRVAASGNPAQDAQVGQCVRRPRRGGPLNVTEALANVWRFILPLSASCDGATLKSLQAIRRDVLSRLAPSRAPSPPKKNP